MAKRKARMPGESNKKEEKIKDYYSISDIIRKILNDLDFEESEANARSIRRIIKSYYEFTNTEGKTKFSERELDLIYGITKKLFLDDRAKRIFNKLGNRKELDIEEIDILANIFGEVLFDIYGDEESKSFLKKIEKIKGGGFMKCAEDLKSKFENEYENMIEELYSLNNSDRRDEIMDDIKCELTKTINKFKDKIDEESYMEYALHKIEESKENDREKVIEILKYEKFKYDMFKNRDSEMFFLNSFFEAIETLKNNKKIDCIDVECIKYSNELMDIVTEEMIKNQMTKMVEKVEKSQ